MLSTQTPARTRVPLHGEEHGDHSLVMYVYWGVHATAAVLQLSVSVALVAVVVSTLLFALAARLVTLMQCDKATFSPVRAFRQAAAATLVPLQEDEQLLHALTAGWYKGGRRGMTQAGAATLHVSVV